jgi:signal transduction histidine kinase
LLAWLDVRMSYQGGDVRIAVVLLFAATFAALGWAVGHLREARARALADALTIHRQLLALSSEQARVRESEVLASVGRMAASVAHEVRNPLGVIRASATVLHDELQGGSPDAVQSCDFIRAEVDRLDAFIGKLLGYSRPTGLDDVPTDPSLLLAQVQARVVGEPVPSVSVTALRASLDAELLLPALVNLLQNAQQSGAEHVRVEARAERGGLVIDVRDDGLGVSEATREHLFEPFFTTKRTGTGLGLAMARKLVEAHRGTLRYVPAAGLGDAGEGACFRVSLPEAEAS